MRLTSKIFLGLLAAIFGSTLLLMIYLATTEGKEIEYEIFKFNEETSEITLPKHKVLLIENTAVYTQKSKILCHTDINKKDKLTLPKELINNVEKIIVGDTLKLKFSLSKFVKIYNKNWTNSNVESMNISLYVDSSVNIISKNWGLGLDFKNIQSKNVSLSLAPGGGICLDRCILETLNIATNGALRLENSSIKTYNMDLDGVNNDWKVINCNIDTENLTGSRNSHVITLPKSECKTMNWIPKNENAKLRIQLEADEATVTFK